MKSYTDLEQSKKLADILPLESADMHYWWEGQRLGVGHSKELQEGFESRGIDYTPCWSLAALLELMPNIGGDVPILKKQTNGKKWGCWYESWHVIKQGDNPVDACYEMILWLHEQKLL